VHRQLHQQSGLIAGRKTLRLYSEEIGSDVGTCEAAPAAGRVESAVAVYQGPFLDGARPFETWVSERRAHYAACQVGALEKLTDLAADAGDLDRAREWSRRAAAEDPLNSRLAIAHVELLLRCDDRAGALLALRAHADRLQAELGITPSPRLLELEARIQSGSPPGQG
jgi:DNA-binding SARP family transcriptional activator